MNQPIIASLDDKRSKLDYLDITCDQYNEALIPCLCSKSLCIKTEYAMFCHFMSFILQIKRSDSGLEAMLDQ